MEGDLTEERAIEIGESLR
ncbi:MAG: hypothetical protein M3422_08565 [Actinomycetota bacterium]|nr:hypothetical protein [Actinomycetota bacterium]